MEIPDLDRLRRKNCKPCEGGVTPFSEEEARNYLNALKGWEFGESHSSIQKTYVMKNFLAAVKCIQGIARLAEREDHHPDVHLTGYRILTIELSTHAIRGLSENDFILASKIETLPKELK